jgi:glucose-6-phosphate dehydrogenase-like protein
VQGFFVGHRGHHYASTALMGPMTKAFVADIHGFVAARGLELVGFGKGERKRSRVSGQVRPGQGGVVRGPGPGEGRGVTHPAPLQPGDRGQLRMAVLDGDRSLFTSSEGLAAAWRAVMPLLAHPPEVAPYAQESWGPEMATALAAPHGWYLQS